MITLLATPEELSAGTVEVAGEAYRHLFRARRLAVGDRVRVVDGRGVARWGEVVAVDRRCGRLRLGEAAPANEAALRLELVLAPLRRERASWLVEKATEVGVAAVRFVATSRTPRDFGEGTLERLRRVAAAALEQCHRSSLPVLSGVHRWEELGGLLGPAAERWFLDTGEPGGGEGAAAGSFFGNRAALLVGPEGGWSGEERAHLLELGCRPVGLGPRTLRVETAALVGAALLLLPPFAAPERLGRV